MNKLIIALPILAILMISGCEDKLTPEEASSIVNEANRLGNLCSEQISISYNMINKVDTETYSNQLGTENYVCNEYRGYLQKNLNVLDYNEKGERDNWGTNELSRLDKNDEANDLWYDNQKYDNSAYQPIITPTNINTPSNNVDTSQSTTDNNGDDIIVPWNKCFYATGDAKKDARNMGRPTEKINSAINICENALQFYEELPLGTYSYNGRTIDYNQQYRRDMVMTIQESSIKWLKAILDPNNIFYNTDIPEPSDPVPYDY